MPNKKNEFQKEKQILLEHIQKKGLRKTAQRELILDIFLRTEEHLSSEDLYWLVHKKYPDIGQTTVYRTLKLLTEAGLAREVRLGDGRTYYEHHFEQEHHDHMICTECGKVIEFFSAELEAMQDAMEIAIGNIPNVEGKVYVFPDISGSMHSPVTGYRKGASSKVRCVDVAALVAAAVLRRNPRAEVIPFESKALEINLNPRDSVMTNAEKLASLPCGGTNCSAPLALLNRRKAQGDLVIYVSDSESWIDAPTYGRFGGGATETMKQWAEFKRWNPQAKMVCIDIQPYGTVQAQEREDILNVGGFSDQVFELITEFAAGRLSDDHWVGVIEAVEL